MKWIPMVRKAKENCTFEASSAVHVNDMLRGQ